MADDRKQKKLDLLKSAVEKDRSAPSGSGGAPGAPSGGQDGRIMYRGRPVGRSAGGSAPGAPGSSQRNQPRPDRGSKSGSGDSGDIKQAIQKLNNLFNDGLITKAEYEAKKAEILNRL